MDMKDQFSSIQSEEALKRLVSELDEVIKQLFSTKAEPGELIDKHVSSGFRSDLNDFLGKYDNAIDLNKALLSLKEDLLKREVFEIQIAKEMPQRIYQSIQNWLKINLGKSFILKVSVNKEILGGLIINYAGKYGDFSLKKKLSKDLNL